MPTSGTASAVTGVIAMVLLTLSVVLGVAISRRPRRQRLPRAAVWTAHQNLSLLAAGFVAVHIATAVAARFAGVGLVAALVPFAAGTGRAWMGLGTIAADLMIALIVTSLLRRRLGRRWWRAVHWLAYACWPAALVHSAALSPDRRAGHLRDLAFGCVLAVVLAIGWRLAGALRGPTGSTAGSPAGSAAAVTSPAARS
jgi:DMSO/TMAO reductase YedYZ heme-binding membrane subunit